MIHCFRHIFIQNTQSQELLASIGICNTTVAGDTRFDRVYSTSKATEKIAMLDEFCQNSTVIVAGSTWPKDEDLLLEIASLLQKDVKLIIAPHEINSARIDELISRFGLSCARYTNPNLGNLSDVRILFIDTIGILSSAYGYGHIAYIGGGFGVGIHNTLEPATFGIPVIFGPNYAKFREAKELIALNAAFSINNSQQLKEVLNRMLNEKLRHKAGSAAKLYVEQNIGATQTILTNL
jgi:3-deoxy-D-manno-octulosonic-acid transferase